MSRPDEQAEFALITDILNGQPSGMKIGEIEDALAARTGAKPNRRTLQRRLQKMQEALRVEIRGESTATLYRLTETGASFAEPYIPISVESGAIRASVRRPMFQRRPVGYQRDFLEGYEPNRTFYLSELVRRDLHMMGRTQASNDPRAGTYVRDILGRLLVDLSWASSKLEGNTYTRLDTENLISFARVADGKDRTETQMILNHKDAIEFLVTNADMIGFDISTILNLHGMLAADLLADAAAAGRLRTRPVEVSGTVYVPPAMPQVIDECFRAILTKAAAIHDPFEQSFFVMVHLPYLQPFEDVNKRVSRLAANIPFIKTNLCPLSFIDVPERAYIDGTLGVYELTQVDLLRDVFVWAYERSCHRYLAVKQTLVSPDPLKLKYRSALLQAVQDMILGLKAPSDTWLEEVARSHAESQDREAFVVLLSEAIRALHGGNFARYGVRPSHFEAWEKKFRS